MFVMLNWIMPSVVGVIFLNYRFVHRSYGHVMYHFKDKKLCEEN